MPRVIQNKEESKFWNAVVKIKKLQSLNGVNSVVIIPSNWLNTLKWDKHTLVSLTIDPLDESIRIKYYGKETGKPVELDDLESQTDGQTSQQ